MHKISRVSILTIVLVMSLSALFAGVVCAKEKATKGYFDFAKTDNYLRELETRPDFPASITFAEDYVYSLLAIGETITPTRRTSVINYVKGLQQKDGGFVPDSGVKTSSILFTNAALDTLGYLNAASSVDAVKAKAFVASLKNQDGGFGFSREKKASSLATTYHAVRILKTLGALDLVDRAKTAAYVKGFERKSGGFGFVMKTGVASPMATYMAAYVLNAIGNMDDTVRKNAVSFLSTTPYLNKQNRERPDLNEQLYALKALKELRASEKIDKQLAMAFLKKIYIPVNGGFGPLEGYGSSPDSTTTSLRILVEMGKLKFPGKALQLAKK